MQRKNLVIYDTTLRDGMQTTDIVDSAESRLAITKLLHNFGVDYIEGGFVDSNEIDDEYFRNVSGMCPGAKVAIFGRTAMVDAEKMEESGMKVFTLVGKSSEKQVSEVLRKKPEGYLKNVGDCINHLSGKGEIVYDAEFFFPAWAENKDYALKTLGAAKDNGAGTLVLCDTTGMVNYWDVGPVIDELSQNFDVKNIGVHFHNDRGLALANTLEAIRHGVPHIQGTVNGLGERCGNTNIVEVICNLHELGWLKWPKISEATDLSNEVSRLVGINLAENASYVGSNAFSHKGGMHSDGNLKANAYRRIDPEIFGNQERYPLSSQSGSAIIVAEANKYGIELERSNPIVAKTLREIKKRGLVGDAQFLSILYDVCEGDTPFTTANMDVSDNYTAAGFLARSQKEERKSRAKVAVVIGEKPYFGSSEGNGPVNAMDGAFQEALRYAYPKILGLKLQEYKVSVVPGAKGESGTASQVKLDCVYRMNGDKFTSKTKDTDILGASHRNIGDAYKYLIIKNRL